MIELFDARRLRPQADHSLALALACLLLVAGGLAAYGWNLQRGLHGLERQRAELQQALQTPAGAAPPSAALLADLERQASALEAESGLDTGAALAPGPTPSTWLQRLATLAAADISLTRIELDRGGDVHIEGQAGSAQAVSRFVQAWDQAQGAGSVLPARSVDLRQGDNNNPGLRFKLRATAAASKAGP